MTNHTFENPGQFVLPKERQWTKYAAIGAGSAALAAVLAGGIQSDPKFDIKNNAQSSISTTVEQIHDNSQELTGAVLSGEIEQDEIPSLVIEQSTLEFAEKYDITLQPGQSEVDMQSAQAIEDAVRAVTGGAVQPGTTFRTHLDSETGYIVSTYVDDESK